MAVYMKAKKAIIFGTKNGPGAYLAEGQMILASKVNESYVDSVRDGARSESAELIELDDSTNEVEINKEIPEPGKPNSGLYDPTSNKVADVVEYLKTATPEEVARVQAAEAAGNRQGGPSATIAKFKADNGGDES